MPKVKTHSSAKKRFKVTGSGKLKYKKANRRHNLGDMKSKDRKRNLRQEGTVFDGDAPRVRAMLNLPTGKRAPKHFDAAVEEPKASTAPVAEPTVQEAPVQEPDAVQPAPAAPTAPETTAETTTETASEQTSEAAADSPAEVSAPEAEASEEETQH